MSCKVRQRLTDKLIDKGVIDKDTHKIREYGLFEDLNKQFTDVAKVKYGVGDGKTQLFSPTSTEKGIIAVPHTYLMDKLEESIDNYNKYNLPKEPSAPYTYSKLESLRDDSVEPVFFPDEKRIIPNTEEAEYNRASMLRHVLFNKKQGKFTASEVLENIIDNYDSFSKEGDMFLEKALLMVNKTKAKVKFVSKYDVEQENVVMLYNSLDNTIEVDKKVLERYSLEDVIESFLHEATHSVTVNAFRAPTDDAQKNFRDFIRKSYRLYKENSDGSNSYGFTNELEFIAEAFTNPKFQAELQSIDNGEQSLWQRFLSLIKGIFGLESQNFSELVNQITKATNHVPIADNVEREAGILFKKAAPPFKKPDKSDIDKRLQRTIMIATENLRQALSRSKASKKESGGREEFQLRLEELITEMKSYKDAGQWEAITQYLRSLKSTIKNLQNRLDKEDIDKADVLETINSYEEYLSTFDMVEEFEELISDAKYSESPIINPEEIKKIKRQLKKTKGIHTELVNDFIQFKAKHMVKVIANSKVLTQVEADWRDNLRKDFRNKGIVSESETEWVTRQMNTIYAEEIELDLQEVANDIIEGVDHDISKQIAALADPLNTNGRLFQIVINMVADTREKINSRIIQYDTELEELKKKLEKEKGTKRPSKLYENILEKDAEGNYYIKGKYSATFNKKMFRTYFNYQRSLAIWINRFEEQGMTEEEYKNEPYYKKIVASIDKWKAKNLNKHDLSSLSEIELELIAKYKELVETVDKETKSRGSLIKERYGEKYYKLPSITKSDLERIVEADTKGLRKDKIADFGKIRTDDVEFNREAVDPKGNPLRRLRIHFRGKLDSDQQSLDLLTMMRLERLNGINYEEKSKVELQLRAIEEISGNKEYYRKSKKNSGILRNVFRQNEDITTFKGKEGGNEYNRIKSYLEGAIYDNLHDSAGTINGLDVNKIMQFINGTTAFIGMSVNIGSGLANLSNGFSQLFIEAAGKDHVSWKSLLKAEKMYTQDIPKIMADLSSPVKNSFTNQVIQMFDVYGGFSVSDHAFVKDTLLKTFGNAHTLSGLQSMGEHMMQGILAMAVLDNLKVMNADHKYIDKEGNVVTEKKAASYLDMLKRGDKGKLSMDEKAVFSKHNLTTDYHDGGKAHINLLIKKKIHDAFGAYDPNLQNELYRTWYGKLLMLFKRFLIPGLQHRWKGVASSTKNRTELTEAELSYNTSVKQYEEGTYTTLIRFMSQSVLPNLRSLKLMHTKEYWNNMSEYERANLKKASVEMVIAFGMVPLLAIMLESTFDEGEDDEALWFAAYQLRRLESELSQYLDISEAWRITKNPVAGTRLLQNTIEVVGDVLTPWNIMEEDSKGQNNFAKHIKKVTPVWIQLDKQWKQSYNFINNQAN